MNSLDSAETMRLWTEILTSKSVNECTQDKEAVESSISLSQDQEVNDDDPDAHSVSFSQDQPADVDEFGTYPVSSSSDQAQIHEQTDDQFGYTDAENPDDVGKQSEHTAAERFDDENEDQRSDQSEQTYLAHHGDARSDQTYLSDHEDQNPDQEDQSPHEKPDLGDRPSILADQHSETSPNVKDKATQTDPVIISTLRPTNIDTSESSITRAMNGSRSSRSSSDNSEGLAPHSTDTKPRLQSPMLSGTLPPPSTPETLQDLTSVNVGISLLIVNELDGIKRLSMGESRHAPRNYTGRQTSPGQKWGLNNRYQTFASSASKADDSALNSRRPSPSPVRSGDPETRASATTVTLAKKAIDDEDETKRTSLSGSAESSSRPSLSPPFKHTDSETVAPATACPPPKPPTGDEENSGYCVENPTDHKSVHIEPLDNSSRNGKDEPKGTNLPPHLRHPEHVAETTQRNPIAEGNSISRSNQSEGWKEDHSTEESFTNRSDTAGIPQGDESTEKTSNNRSDLVEASQGDQSTEKTSINGSDLAEAPQGDQSTEGTSTRSGGRLNNEIPSVTSTQRPSTGELSKQKPDLTPSLGTLKAVPAPRIAKVAENREDQIFFDGWGTPEARVTPCRLHHLLRTKNYQSNNMQLPEFAG